jgi:dolichol-phosphate mannosyltransferase
LKSLVVIPTLNEEAGISEVLSQLRSLPSPPDVVVVDDSSDDNTQSLVKEFSQRDSGVHLIARKGQKSFAKSYIEGFKYALKNGYEAVVCMDADLSHNPQDVPRLLAALENADIVIGSRYVKARATVENWPLRRKILSRISSMYVRAITGLPLTDPMAGFKAFRAEALARLNFDAIVSSGFAFQTESVYRLFRLGARLGEISIVFTDRTKGKSKMSLQRITEAMVLPFKLRSYVKHDEGTKG